MSTAGQHAAPHRYDPKRPYYTPMPERTPAAIRAELPAELRARFEAEYEAALEEARRTYDLGRVDEVVRSWWQTVWADRKPGMEQARELGRRWLAGEPVETFPYQPGEQR